MRYSYDAAHDALLITFRDATYDNSKEIFPGFVVDLDEAGRPMGLDIYFDASKFVDIEALKKSGIAPLPPVERRRAAAKKR